MTDPSGMPQQPARQPPKRRRLVLWLQGQGHFCPNPRVLQEILAHAKDGRLTQDDIQDLAEAVKFMRWLLEGPGGWIQILRILRKQWKVRKKERDSGDPELEVSPEPEAQKMC